ncbi:YidC/Oxa1 family membrane protein insertase [Actinomadura scrupuli]|uniref:YidC/Oxa1 family membrane protein insertase n=1 Tax=Actinomadura scrupuli TaxID=559629 RepID=UPI003D997F0B
MFLFDAPVGAAYHLVTALATMFHPVFGGPATAAAIVLFTLGIRLLLLPLAVAQARGERARARLAPQVGLLREKHAGNPERAQREISALYAAEGASMFAGCLPALAQWPFFAIMYRLFVSASVAGGPNVLLAHTLLGAPLGQNLTGVVGTFGLLSPEALVFFGLLTLIAAVAWWSSRRMRAATATAGDAGTGAAGRVLRLLPYGTVAMAALVPLAAGLYLLTSTAWTAAERALLRRDVALAA